MEREPPLNSSILFHLIHSQDKEQGASREGTQQMGYPCPISPLAGITTGAPALRERYDYGSVSERQSLTEELEC